LLRIAGIRFSQSPDRLDIERIEAQQPYGRFLISVEQKLNIVSLLAASGSGEHASGTTPAPVMR